VRACYSTGSWVGRGVSAAPRVSERARMLPPSLDALVVQRRSADSTHREGDRGTRVHGLVLGCMAMLGAVTVAPRCEVASPGL
jgi:hypothetical protein